MLSAAALCLAMQIYHEARGEGFYGQVAVAQVVMNRTEDPAYPDTVCAVILEDRGPRKHDCQFSWTCDGKSDLPLNQEAFDRAKVIAEEVLAGSLGDITHGATHFHSTSIKPPRWAHKLTFTYQTGQHRFFKEN